MKFFETHAHLTDKGIVTKAGEMIKRAKNAKVEKIINICTDKISLEHGLRLSEKYNDIIFNTAATTPHDIEKDGSSFFPIVEKAAKNKKIIAIGETGLDYFYRYSKPEMQKEYLIKYFDVAKKYNLPVIIHCRDAFDDLFAITDKYYNGPLVLHCFTGSVEEVKRALEKGWFISFSGIVTFKNSDKLREVVKAVPIERMFIETDSPLLAPRSKRGRLNEPSFIVEIAGTIAKVKNISLEDVSNITYENANAFFFNN